MEKEYTNIPDIDYTKGVKACMEDLHEKLAYEYGMIGAKIVPNKIKAYTGTIADMFLTILRLSEIKYISYGEIQDWSILQPGEDNTVPVGKLYLEPGWAVDTYRNTLKKGGETNASSTND